MEKDRYKIITEKYTPKEHFFKNGLISFIVGGLMGVIGQGLIDIYIIFFKIPYEQAPTYMIVTLIFIGCFLTAIGIFDKWVDKAKCGLIIPITGFAHSVQAAAMEYRKEGLITGIGANMFKLAGSVIVYGTVSAYTLGILRLILLGV